MGLALLIAAQHGHLDVIKPLIKHKAKVNQAKPSGMTPLWTASHKGHASTVKVATHTHTHTYIHTYTNHALRDVFI